jgi:uncharacterized protein (DUF1697 family)
MKELKTVFEKAGLASVRTYINSGNVIFSTAPSDQARLARKLERAIARRFGFAVPILVRNVDEIRAIVSALPGDWVNDQSRKCDVLFLWDEVDQPSILGQLQFNSEIEDVRYTSGAVIWCIARRNATKSRLPRIVGTPLYQQMTIRNCNTARKLLNLMEEAPPS